jgi:hypothetical protein
MSSTSLVFHLIGRNAGLKRECNARRSVHPQFDDGEKAVGLVVREKFRQTKLRRRRGSHSPESEVVRVEIIPNFLCRRLFNYTHILIVKSNGSDFLNRLPTRPESQLRST